MILTSSGPDILHEFWNGWWLLKTCEKAFSVITSRVNISWRERVIWPTKATVGLQHHKLWILKSPLTSVLLKKFMLSVRDEIWKAVKYDLKVFIRASFDIWMQNMYLKLPRAKIHSLCKQLVCTIFILWKKYPPHQTFSS